MNIFHELAEKAFEGRYLLTTDFNVAADLPYGEDFSVWWDITDDWFEVDMFYNMPSYEQALALLFIGEMYESQ
jgi:hypothetical protein